MPRNLFKDRFCDGKVNLARLFVKICTPISTNSKADLYKETFFEKECACFSNGTLFVALFFKPLSETVFVSLRISPRSFCQCFYIFLALERKSNETIELAKRTAILSSVHSYDGNVEVCIQLLFTRPTNTSMKHFLTSHLSMPT